MTAEEFLIDYMGKDDSTHPNENIRNEWIERTNQLKQFAKLHCEKQLEAILENVNLIGDNAHVDGRPPVYEDSVYVVDQIGPDYIYTVNKDSIIEAYPLENIK